MVKKNRNKKNRKQKETREEEATPSSTNTTSSSDVSTSDSNAPLIGRIPPLLHPPPIADDYTCYSTDVSSHFETTPETTPDTTSDRQVNAKLVAVASGENLFNHGESDVVSSDSFGTPPPGPTPPPLPPASMAIIEDDIKKEFDFVEFADAVVDFCEDEKIDEIKEEEEDELGDFERALVPHIADTQTHCHLMGGDERRPSYQFTKELTSWCDREQILATFEPPPVPAFELAPLQAPTPSENQTEESLPDLIDEHGLIVSDVDDRTIDLIEPDETNKSYFASEIEPSESTNDKQLATQEVVNFEVTRIGHEAIETSGLKLPLTDDPIRAQLATQETVKSNIISTEFMPLAPALDYKLKVEPLPICDSPKKKKTFEQEMHLKNHFDDVEFRFTTEQNELESLVSETPPPPMLSIEYDESNRHEEDDSDDVPSVADSSSQTTDSFWLDPDELTLTIEPSKITSTYSNQLLRQFQQQRAQRIGLNLKLKSTTDQVHIWIHRILLQGLVGDDEQISDNSHFHELPLSSKALAHLVVYLYTGELDLTLDSCEEYLSILSVLGPIPFVQAQVQAHLEQAALNTSTCGRVMEITRAFGLSSMSVKLMGIVGSSPVDNFDIIRSMDRQTMCEFIAKDYIKIDEIELLDMLKQWIEQAAEHAVDLDLLLSHVRWEVIPSDFIVNQIVNDPIFTQGSGAKPIMAAMGHHLSRAKFVNDLTLRNRRMARDVSVVVGGAGLSGRSPVCFVADDDHDYADFEMPVEMLPMFAKLQGHQVVNVNNFVFILGGEYTNGDNKKDVSSNVYCIDLRLQTISELRPMLANRTNFTASVINDDTIVVIGGRNEKGNIVGWPERYNIGENKWTPFDNGKNIDASKLLARYCHTATAIGNDSIIVTGGYVHEQGKRALVCSDQVLLLDANDMSVISSSQLSIRRCWHVAEVVHDKWLIVAGGSVQRGKGGREGVLELELINLSALTSELLLERLPYPISSPGVICTNQKRLVLSGGWSEVERRFLHSSLVIQCEVEDEEEKMVLTINSTPDSVPPHFNMHGVVRAIY